MLTRRILRWSLIVLGAVSVGIVSCGPPNKPPPAVDEGVTIRLIVDGPGRIGSLPTFTCPDDCEWTLPADELVSIYGIASTGNVFVAWDGACSADTLNFACTRAFQDGDVVTARFAQHALRLNLTGDGEGVFTVTGGGISAACDADCGLALPALSYAIQYEARGTTGTTLGPWGGACETATLPGYCLVQVSGSTEVSKLWVHPPVAVDDPDYVVDRGATLAVPAAAGVLANDRDTEGDTLTAQLVRDAANGRLSLATNGGFTYTPAASFSGEDTFTYRARDAFGNLSNVAEVTITVVAPDPEIGELTVTPTSATLDIDDTVTLTVDFTDVVGDPDLSVTWDSSDDAIATVTPTGPTTAEVTAIAPGGPITITVTSTFDPTNTATTAITVNEPEDEDVVVAFELEPAATGH